MILKTYSDFSFCYLNLPTFWHCSLLLSFMLINIMLSPSLSPPTILLLIAVVALLSSTSLAFITPNSSPCTFNGITHQKSTLFATRKSNNDDDTSSNINPAKKAALEGVLQRIERNYGRGSIVKLGDADRMVVDCIGSGSMTLG